MSGPSREAIEAAHEVDRVTPRPVTKEEILGAAYPIVRRDVAKEIVAWLRGRTGAYGGGFTSADDVADAIEIKFATSAGSSPGSPPDPDGQAAGASPALEPSPTDRWTLSWANGDGVVYAKGRALKPGESVEVAALYEKEAA